MTIGVLALQGDFAEHIEVLRKLSAHAVEVRTLGDLSRCDALIIPGGESTVVSFLMEEFGLLRAIPSRNREGTLPILGTCAGSILLAREVSGKNPPRTLELLDIGVERNAYGTQRESFQAKLSVKGREGFLYVSFIRAPKIVRVADAVEVLASHEGTPVLVRQGDILASTFHTEVSLGTWLHEQFLMRVFSVTPAEWE